MPAAGKLSLHATLWQSVQLCWVSCQKAGCVRHDTRQCVSFSGATRISHLCCPLGFTGDFWRAYHEVIPKAPGFDRRKELYLLYHYLNHTNLFGGETAGWSASSSCTPSLVSSSCGHA
jgi:fructosamine-3-kinase